MITDHCPPMIRKLNQVGLLGTLGRVFLEFHAAPSREVVNIEASAMQETTYLHLEGLIAAVLKPLCNICGQHSFPTGTHEPTTSALQFSH